MYESAEFLESLKHQNPMRPRFTIKPAEHVTMLEIQHLGELLKVPISEILAFASRWKADRERQDSKASTPRLRIHPYPLYNIRMDDPDRANWWAE